MTEPSAKERAGSSHDHGNCRLCDWLEAEHASSLAEKDAKLAEAERTLRDMSMTILARTTEIVSLEADLAAMRVALELVMSVVDESAHDSESSYASRLTSIREVAADALASSPGTAPAHEALSSQVDRLARFIMEEIAGEPSQSEGAIDTAIRLLSDRAAWLAWVRDVLPLLPAVMKLVDEIKAAAPEGEMVKRWVEDAGERARALLARSEVQEMRKGTPCA